MRVFKDLIAGMYLAVFLASCTSVVALETFDDRAAYTAILISKVSATTQVRHEQGALSKEEGMQIALVLEEAQTLLEIATAANANGDIPDANQKLEYAIAILNELEKRVAP